MNQVQLETALDNLAQLSKIPPIKLDIWQKIPSTNQKLWQLIDQGMTLPRVAIALEQTAGRGQWGRTWHSLPGGLYLSLALTPNLSLVHSSHLILAVAWGLATVLRSLDLPILLKWPNDLVLHKRKLGGIKIETRVYQNTITHAVIGVGINYINPTPATGINLQSIAKQFSLEKLALLTIEGIFQGYFYYLNQGIKPLLSAYLKLLSNVGQQVTINNSPGVVLGVTEAGELRVRVFSLGASSEICLEPGTISLGYYEEMFQN